MKTPCFTTASVPLAKLVPPKLTLKNKELELVTCSYSSDCLQQNVAYATIEFSAFFELMRFEKLEGDRAKVKS